MDDVGYAYFQRKVLSLTGVDLRGYKSEQMVRRLGTLMARCNTSSFTEFGRLLETKPEYIKHFLDFFTINVSEFFRDTSRFAELQKVILPQLLKRRTVLRIWSAGCSNGAEPYSLAIILAELTPSVRHFILATDVDATTLKKAKDADSYNANDIRNVEPRLLSKYFVSRGDRFALTDAAKSCVEFRQHDLLSAASWGDFDLVLCRNVVIYFTDEVKERIFASLVGALHPGGILFVGDTETVRSAKELGLETLIYSFYRRTA